jgi:methylated-DNA-[protein]-cysteine S-methyltransferase
MRINPFNSYVPCHRVVASNLYIGGFFGQWAGRKTARTSKDSQPNEGDPLEVQSKIVLLKEEGVSVDNRGFLVDAGGLVWKPTEGV